jgi:hypothetical protein
MAARIPGVGGDGVERSITAVILHMQESSGTLT